MGGHLWFYYVPYQPDIDKALQELKRTEFAAGRYNPVIRFLDFPVGPGLPSPGPGHFLDQGRVERLEGGGDEIDFGYGFRLRIAGLL